MPIKVYAVAFSLLVLMAGCTSSDTPAPANSSPAPASASPANMLSPGSSPASPPTSNVKAKLDTCQLLSSADLKDVQGEVPTETKRSDREDGGFIVSQCYYSLPTTSNSVVLNVTLTSETGKAEDVRKFWEDTFGKEEREGKAGEREREREKRAEKQKPRERGEEEEEGAPPQKVNGLGDEAFWIASRVGGALYVLKKDLFFRISVGGAGDDKAKLNKSRTLAQRALKRI